MNVIGSRPDGWWRDRKGASQRFIERVQALAAHADEKLTVVLDGRPLDDLPEGEHDGVHVLYARRGGRNAADDRIVELLESMESTSDVTVVTSDRDLSERARDLGATVVGAGSFLARL
jgi:predicted RNA-binding protein with PIN domain